jgi:hypothetical protein
LWWALGVSFAVLVLVAGVGVGVYLGRSGLTENDGGHYRAVDDLCAAVDLGPMTEVYPTRTGARPIRTRNGRRTDLRCELDLMSNTVAVSIGLDVSIFADGSGLTAYDDRRREFQEQYSWQGDVGPTPLVPASITGLGRAAFSVVTDRGGVHLVGFDGNLYFDLFWWDPGHTDRIPPGTVDRLTRLARNVLGALKADPAD